MGEVLVEFEGPGSSPLKEIARVLSSRGIAATVVDDAVVALLPRQQPTPEGGRHVTYHRYQIRSLAELGELLGDDGGQSGQAENASETASAMTQSSAASDRPWWLVEGLLPPFSARSVICGLLTFLLSMSAWDDLMSAKPHAPLGTGFVALYFLRQAYRRPQNWQPGQAVVPGQARLLSLVAGLVFLVMLMLLGHSGDGFLFGANYRPVNTLVAFIICVVLLMLLRGSERRMRRDKGTFQQDFFGTALPAGEGAFAVGGFVWLLVLCLMPPHRPVFEHGLSTPAAAVTAPAVTAPKP